jgi:chromosome segregation ATPase
MASKKSKKDAILNELEGVVDVLSMDMTTAMDIKKEKENLKNQIRSLKKEETYLKDVIVHLRATKDKLQNELQTKVHEEDKLKEDLKQARSDKRKQVSRNVSLESRVDRLVKEKKELNASLIRMNNIIAKLKQHISDFDHRLSSDF